MIHQIIHLTEASRRMADGAVSSDAMSFVRHLAGLVWEALDHAAPRAVILHGSVVTGDFVPGKSDVDLLVVVERALTDVEVGRLIESVRGPGRPDMPIDLRVVTRAAAARPVASPPMEFRFGRHPGGPDEIETRKSGEPDLVVELWVARRHGMSIYGSEPAEIIGPVPDTLVLGYGLRLLDHWERLTDDDANAELMVLTACRIWHFAASGEIGSKSVAAAWTSDQAPALAAIPAALRRRAGELGVTITEGEIGMVIAAARRAAEGRLAAASLPSCVDATAAGP